MQVRHRSCKVENENERMRRRKRHLGALAVIVALGLLAVAIPVLGADPLASPSAEPGATASAIPVSSSAPTRSAKPAGDESGSADKQSKGGEIEATVTGTVGKTTDGKWPTYALTAGGTTWELSAGPPWFWGDANPLNAYVGKSVTVVGEHGEGDTEFDVMTVDGKTIRAEGKPPWAGGPWVVGPKHPGWKDWMTSGKPSHGQGDTETETTPLPAKPG